MAPGGSDPAPPERPVPAEGGSSTQRLRPLIMANQEDGWFSGGTPMPWPLPCEMWPSGSYDVTRRGLALGGTRPR
eukprot:CAMPEP_0174740718 /NCGR_PEP_ID=MMETSP1094-20130205/74368_1 /TAXON_ID=156173 /ORGANISM="Chrysochromulina brevifilum, Strain UTEX LB 985" /LENGTH=74 /DNA_ID=CAMNT_0015944481 /DNA_START=42 /DNA_END=266 /DNA_ORIENTATION=-